ncbi:hypothetical protein [Paraburkholderia sp. SIMBA_030]|uniref:hypothetical protein n=1 Tax=Paraburkholderia sp. SIMBA_030 TaxID=3085773 RepID=UPI00397B6E35
MDDRTSLKYQLISAWCGPAFLVTFVFFWGVLGHNLPNPSPALSASDLAARYLANLGQIRLRFIVSMITVVLYMPWTAVLTAQMARIEGKFPVLSFLQLLGGGLTVMVVSFSVMFWAVAAFRPERDPASIQLLTDLGWLCIDLQYACTTLQMVAAALVGLADKSTVPLFPRWVCFLTIWCGISFFPASLTGVLQTGPFAWSGVLSYYFPYFCWLCWYITASIYMIKEVRRRMAVSDIPETAGDFAHRMGS